MAKKILVVDDEPAIVLIVSTRLKASGYDVVTASDGQMGYELAQKEKPDLIILDLMLPKLDGYKVCGLLKKSGKFSRIPIILFSAKAQESDMALGREMGADAYLVKPFKPEILLGKVEELLAAAG